MEKKGLSIYPDKELSDKIKEEAQKEMRSVNNYLIKVIQNNFESQLEEVSE